MLSLIIFLKLENVDGVSLADREEIFVRHYEDCPWPRIPTIGERIVFDKAADVFMDSDVKVHRVTFDMDGDVQIEIHEMAPSFSNTAQLLAMVFEKTLDPYTKPHGRVAAEAHGNLAGLSEVAEVLDVSKQRAHQLSGENKFPKPLGRLRSGPVWLRSEVEEFAQARHSKG